jgi:hypothetical protein
MVLPCPRDPNLGLPTVSTPSLRCCASRLSREGSGDCWWRWRLKERLKAAACALSTVYQVSEKREGFCHHIQECCPIIKPTRCAPPRRMAVCMLQLASSAQRLFCMIFGIACCIPINQVNALKSISILPQYLKQVSLRPGSSGLAADRPLPPPTVSVYELLDHPVFILQYYISINNYFASVTSVNIC